ncbi:unnamed protein product [Symbiodinium necroappetens]|uniref:Uncharacterized protein n=1 Tax=Symbiodinium necroappetens TaxID=1628268 RepID=A0A812T7M1_9DINO|nr:unnamed protein product [Symbiodinium necroappetens]
MRKRDDAGRPGLRRGAKSPKAPPPLFLSRQRPMTQRRSRSQRRRGLPFLLGRSSHGWRCSAVCSWCRFLSVQRSLRSYVWRPPASSERPVEALPQRQGQQPKAPSKSCRRCRRQTYVAFETAASCITALSIDSGWPVSSAPGQMLQLSPRTGPRFK